MGEMMIDLPMEPQLAKTIITSAKLKCTESILSIAAMLLAPNCLVETKDSIQKVRDAQSQYQ
jgi:HrpA-like helicases